MCDHADRIVERVVVDDEARVAGALEHLDQLAERNVLLHRDDVGARHHHVVHPAPAQREDVGEHHAFLRREAALEGAALQHGLQVGAGRARLPVEQRAEVAREPAFGGLLRGRGRLRQHGGKVHARGSTRIAATWRVGVGHGVSPGSPAGRAERWSRAPDTGPARRGAPESRARAASIVVAAASASWS